VPALAGRVIDSQAQPVRRAEVALYLDEAEEPYVVGETQRDGSFVLDLPNEEVGDVRLAVTHTHFEPSVWEAKGPDLARLHNGSAIRLPDIELQRRLTAGFWVATLTFAAMLILIATERLHSTMAAMVGVAVVLGVSLVGRPINEELSIFTFGQAIDRVDFNVIFLVLE
jgi:hypothetical protein